MFNESRIEEAFRFLEAGKHIGKVVIRIRQETPVVLKTPERTILAIPKIFFNPLKSYIITGGLGGVGLQLTDWMIRKGATKLILNSRRGVTNDYQKYCLRKWKLLKNIQVLVSTENSSNIEAAERLIVEANKIGSVGGKYKFGAI